MVEAERKRIWTDVNVRDEGHEHYADIAELQLDQGITTRLLTGTALVATWATYQSVVTQTARRLRTAQNVQRDLETRRSFRENARTYFADELHIDLHPPDTDWNRLMVVNVVRDVFAHANGQIDNVREKDRKRIEKWAETFVGLTISDGYLVVSIDFVRHTFDFVSRLLYDLEDRVNRLSA